MRMPAVPLIAGAIAVLTLAQDPSPAPTLPSAAELYNRALTHVGSEEAVAQVASLSCRVTVAPGTEHAPRSYVVSCLLPDRMHMRAIFEGGATAVMVFDGTHGWGTTPAEDDPALDESGRMSINLPLIFPQAFLLAAPRTHTNMVTVEVVEFNGRPCHRVRVAGEGADGSMFVLLDAGTSRPEAIQVVVHRGTDTAELIATCALSEWAEFAGILLPTRAALEMPVAGSTMLTFSDFTIDKVDAALFEPPPTINAEIEERKARRKGGGGGGG